VVRGSKWRVENFKISRTDKAAIRSSSDTPDFTAFTRLSSKFWTSRTILEYVEVLFTPSKQPDRGIIQIEGVIVARRKRF
jgi:hypothetical protein